MRRTPKLSINIIIFLILAGFFNLLSYSLDQLIVQGEDKMRKINRLSTATSHLGFLKSLTYWSSPTKSHCGIIRLFVRDNRPVHTIKPYIQTIIAIVVGANTIFGKFFSKKLSTVSLILLWIYKIRALKLSALSALKSLMLKETS